MTVQRDDVSISNIGASGLPGDGVASVVMVGANRLARMGTMGIGFLVSVVRALIPAAELVCPIRFLHVAQRGPDVRVRHRLIAEVLETWLRVGLVRRCNNLKQTHGWRSGCGVAVVVVHRLRITV
jgi:predicted naringenin-chalcone synthase